MPKVEKPPVEVLARVECYFATKAAMGESSFCHWPVADEFHPDDNPAPGPADSTRPDWPPADKFDFVAYRPRAREALDNLVGEQLAQSIEDDIGEYTDPTKGIANATGLRECRIPGWDGL